MDTPVLFDRAAVRRHRERAARRLDDFDFLAREAALRLSDRLDDVRRQFPRVLAIGCRGPLLAEALSGKGGIETLVQSDLALGMVRQASGPRLVLDDEALPFADHSFDLVISLLSLHWVNDLPGALVQARRILKPDGLFLAALFGGETLRELAAALAEAEIAAENGLSPRVSPMTTVQDAGNLLRRAGFALPVADLDTLTVSYGDPIKLMRDLSGMGESNAVRERRKSFSRRATLLGALARYAEAHGGADGRMPATFQIITLTGWAPHPDQPKPLAPGSGAISLAEALDGH